MRLSILILSVGVSISSSAFAVDYKISGDIRGGYYSADRDDRNGTTNKTDEARLRIRVGVGTKITNTLKAKVRLAGRYSTDDRNENYFRLFDSIPAGDGLRRGDSTFDEMYLKQKIGNKGTLTFGRMQTKIELDGVAKKSLDTNDSPNSDIAWTDGLYLKYPIYDGWKLHALMQYNAPSGSGKLRRKPLNFSDSDSRISYFGAIEKKSKTGLWAQRGIDVTYLPAALQKDGNAAGRIEDYWAVVGRAAARWPLSSGSAFMLGGELGFASNTQTKAAAGLPGAGDAGNNAYQVTFNWINFVPKHSVGLVLAKADAGWLLSPDFRDNTDLTEIRYKWITAKNQKFEARLRRRVDSVMKTGAIKEREDVDIYLRYTYKF
ncbi:MAG: hypothetical protein GXP13_08485 [Gammaproteobacteria bacterium]|nr:hypothetical protein [Gammaproteobacteria bacterium]